MGDERDRENLRSGSGRLVGVIGIGLTNDQISLKKLSQEAMEIGGNRNLGELEVLKTNEEFRVEYILEESNLGLIVKPRKLRLLRPVVQELNSRFMELLELRNIGLSSAFLISVSKRLLQESHNNTDQLKGD